MKYMGSKARFSKELLPIILKNRKPNQYYVEPFAGGMNVIDKVSGNRIANDYNYYLIQMWDVLVNDDWIPNKFIDKELYNKVRLNRDKFEPWLVGWIGFNCSYSGKYFGGYAGKTQTKNGSIRDYQDEAYRNILKQKPNLKGVKFTNDSYLDMQIPENSVIYCDPPYQNTTGYNSVFNHNIFWDWVREKHFKGHTIFVSEYNSPDDFRCVWQKEAKSSLSANGKIGGNKASVEKLFTL